MQTLENTVAFYYFYILRPNLDRVDPEYLAWFINQPTTQTCLERLPRVPHIKIIPKSAFEELEVVLPPLATQRAIVELERLRQKERIQVGPPYPGPQTAGKRPGAAGHAGTSVNGVRTHRMADRVSQAEINDIAWRACDTFRGTLDQTQCGEDIPGDAFYQLYE